MEDGSSGRGSMSWINVVFGCRIEKLPEITDQKIGPIKLNDCCGKIRTLAISEVIGGVDCSENKILARKSAKADSSLKIYVMVKITRRPTKCVMFDLKDYAKKGFKFMVIGAVGSVVNLGVLYALVQYLKLYYLWAEVIAIVVAFAVNYNGNILVKNINVSKNVAQELAPTPEIMKSQKSEDVSPKSPD